MNLNHSLVYFLARGLASIAAFANSIVLAWFLIPSEFATYGLVMSAVWMISSALFDASGISIARWYSSYNPSDFVPTILLLFIIICFSSALIFSGMLAMGLFPWSARYTWLSLFGAYAYGGFELIGWLRISRQQPIFYLIQNCVRSGLCLIGGSLMAWWSGSSTDVLVIMFLAMLSAGLLFIGSEVSDFSIKFDFPIVRKLFVYGWPLTIVTTSTLVAAFFNRVFLTHLAGKDEAAFFIAASVLVQNTITVLGGAIGTSNFAAASRSEEAGDQVRTVQQLRESIELLAAALLPAGVGLVLIMPSLARVLLRDEYVHPVVAITPWMVAGQIMILLRCYYIDFAFHLAGKTKSLVCIVAPSSAVTIGLSWILIPLWGGVGAAVANLTSSAITLAVSAVCSRTVYPLPIAWKRLSSIVIATTVMASALAALPTPKGTIGLFGFILVGGISFGFTAAMLDVLRSRRSLVRILSVAMSNIASPVRGRP
jgi:O-antigen/teichoic acid export membrane protein